MGNPKRVKMFKELAETVPQFQSLKDFINYLCAPTPEAQPFGAQPDESLRWAVGILIDILIQSKLVDGKEFYKCLAYNTSERWKALAEAEEKRGGKTTKD